MSEKIFHRGLNRRMNEIISTPEKTRLGKILEKMPISGVFLQTRYAYKTYAEFYKKITHSANRVCLNWRHIFYWTLSYVHI